MPPPTGVKLRDSCHLCAASKVKCSKDKPVCARCAERGTRCQYLITQRTGRKASRQNSIDDQSLQASGLPTPPGFPSFLPMPSDSSSPKNTVSSSSSWDMSNPDFNTSLDSLLPPLSTCLTLPFSDTELTRLQAMIGDDRLDTSFETHQDVPAQLGCSISSGEDPTLLMDASCPASLELDLDLEMKNHMLLNSTTEALDAQVDCLGTALRLMNQLSSEKEFKLPPSAHNRMMPCDLADQKPPQRLEEIISDNNDAINTVDCLLQSHDVQDGYCLVIISLIVSKILSRYAAAAQRETLGNADDAAAFSSGPSPAQSGPKPDEPNPQSVQRILAELYQVQGLIDRFSSKLQVSVAKTAVGLTCSPFSGTVLSQLDAELRKGLSNLSLELIDGLRQYWG